MDFNYFHLIFSLSPSPIHPLCLENLRKYVDDAIVLLVSGNATLVLDTYNTQKVE